MKPSIIAIVGASGSGKTYLSKLLQNELNVYLIVSHTTRRMREGEVEGIDHYYIQNTHRYTRSQMLSYTRFAEYEYFALEEQVPPQGYCAYVVDERGLKYLKETKSHKFNIVSIRVESAFDTLINRGIAIERIKRDEDREPLPLEYYDYIIENNGTLEEFEDKIRETYKTIRQWRCKSEPKIYTAIVLDFETGGLDCTDCACTQIAMQAVRLDTWAVLDRYEKYITPYRKQDVGGVPKRKVLKTRQAIAEEEEGVPMKYEPVALTYSAITMEMLNLMGEDVKQVATDVIEFAKRNTLSKGFQCKPILIGQNITFDIGFLQQLMMYGGVIKEFEKVFAGTTDFYGNFQPHYVDTIDLGRLAFAHLPEVTSYKLEILSERFGILLDDAHDAGADVTATLNVAAVCATRLRQEGVDGFVVAKQEKTRSHFKI